MTNREIVAGALRPKRQRLDDEMAPMDSSFAVDDIAMPEEEHLGRRPTRERAKGPDDEMSLGDLNNAVIKLHSELGHPHNRALARAIRLAGGSDRAVAAALRLACDVCARRREPQPVLKAKLHTSSEPWTSVAVDLFELADYAGQVESFLNIVDMFTGFQLVGLLVSKHPAHVFEEFMKGWCGHYGPPFRALVDGRIILGGIQPGT